MKQYLGVLIFCILFLSNSNNANAQIEISEIAWMGTAQSANDEWIELFNTSTETISLDGWKLTAADETPTISLSGSLVGGGHFLLERTNDETVPNISADFIYVGALGNTGEELILSTETETVVTRVPAQSGWPAGDNTTKQTMQWVEGNWITGNPTPKAPYIQPVVVEETLEPTSPPEPEPAPEPVQVPEQRPEVVITPIVQTSIEEKPISIETPKHVLESTFPEPITTSLLSSSTTPLAQAIASTVQEVRPTYTAPKKTTHVANKRKKESIALSAILQQEALVSGTYEVETPRSFWQRLWALPQTIITFIKSLVT